MNKPSVYLCGSITTDPRCLEWRARATDLLSIPEHIRKDKESRHAYVPMIEVLDPCRGKDTEDWTADGLEGLDCIYSNGAFVPRDKRDVQRCDCILVGWWGDPGRQSIGTWMEMGWASAWNKPIIFVDMTEDAYNTKHPFIYKQAEVFKDLDTACAYIRWLLLGSHK